MPTKLVEPSLAYKNEYIEMIQEWRKTGELLVPFVLRYDYTDFEHLIVQINNLKNGIGLKENTVSSSTYWLMADDEMIGATNIRHKLNDRLRQIGGHIGYGIRPSKRMKGHATELLKHALNIAKEMKISKALLTCDKDNVGSAKTIMNNGGILDSEDIVNGTEILRFWIHIK